MNQEELDKKLKKQEILVKDEKFGRIRMRIILVLSLNKQNRKELLIIYLVKVNLLISIKIFLTILKSNFIEL